MELKLHALGDVDTERLRSATPRPLQAYKQRPGNFAIDPKAFFSFYMDPPVREVETIGNVAVVDISGPLEHHCGYWCDSYEAIQSRVAAACGSLATSIVLRIDSPGGDAAGCFEAARAIRQLCADAGKPLIAFVEGHACSAAYALACGAERVVLAPSALVGSIGVINIRPDYSAQNASNGVRFAVIASGDRKSDGFPEIAVTEAEIADTKTIVDSLAGVFFDLVSEMRPALTPDAIRAMDARVFHGASAVQVGLADEVKAFDALVAEISAAPAAEGPDMSKPTTPAKPATVATARTARPGMRAEAAAPATEEPVAAAAAPATEPAPVAEPAPAEAEVPAPAAMPEGFDAFVEQVASTAGVDTATALKEMMNLADRIGGLVRDSLDSGGGKAMSTTAQDKKLAEIAAQAQHNTTEMLATQLSEMTARVEKIEADKAQAAADGRAAKIEAMFAAGQLKEEEREGAAFMLEHKPELFAKTFGAREGLAKPVPIGVQQAGAEGSRPAASATAPKAAASAADISASLSALSGEQKKAYAILMNSRMYTHEVALQRITEVSQNGLGAHAG